jgi:hypothetical protein
LNDTDSGRGDGAAAAEPFADTLLSDGEATWDTKVDFTGDELDAVTDGSRITFKTKERGKNEGISLSVHFLDY